MLLLLLVILLPTAWVLWFMNAAMENERLAVRQKLVEAYRGPLTAAQSRLAKYWEALTAQLESLPPDASPSTLFAKCIESGLADAVVVFKTNGQVAYPNTPELAESIPTQLEGKWAEAGRLEQGRKDLVAAAKAYETIAVAATNLHVIARAWQAQARCLVQAGDTNGAIGVITQQLAQARFDRAIDPQGRVIAANCDLLVLELAGAPESLVSQAAALRLKRRLLDYENDSLASSQRRFLMNELRRRSAGQAELPNLAAEELAARAVESRLFWPAEATLRPSPIPNVWQIAAPNRRILALFQLPNLLQRMEMVLKGPGLPAEARLSILPPAAEDTTAMTLMPIATQLPGWRLGLALKDQTLFEAASQRRRAAYWWTAILGMAATVVLALAAMQMFRRQAALARLKNDLAATVSHELKTPLAAMRVLLDTLLDSKNWNEQTAREYLQLIAKENERLTGLIEHFLVFSRMERNQHPFHFREVATREIIDSAAAAARERFQSHAHLEVDVQKSLPAILGDSDALLTALWNLLDNAHKYSGENKQIILRAGARNGSVAIEIEDNGIGIPSGEIRRIFHRFYQVDQRLSRTAGGCGLGLSIVQFIVKAHHGRVRVLSQPGQGSVFTIELPAIQTEREEHRHPD